MIDSGHWVRIAFDYNEFYDKFEKEKIISFYEIKFTVNPIDEIQIAKNKAKELREFLDNESL